jgi:alkylhydroperoxidase family enzyme
MTWIKTIAPEDADGTLKDALAQQRALYPKEYGGLPAQPASAGANGIIASHSLIPGALEHAFATFGSLMSPDLPLERRHHEMIATVVSVTNRCRY